MTNQIFQNVNAQRWNDIKAAIQSKAGVTINADAGTAKAHGIEFSWAYGGESLAVTVISVSLMDFMTEQEVMDKFAAWIGSVA